MIFIKDSYQSIIIKSKRERIDIRKEETTIKYQENKERNTRHPIKSKSVNISQNRFVWNLLRVNSVKVYIYVRIFLVVNRKIINVEMFTCVDMEIIVKEKKTVSFIIYVL